MSTTTNSIWASGVNPSSSTDSTESTKKSNTMDMQGFLKLMAAQMQNQSLTSSSTDNSQYITEMALFSAIQAMNTMTSESNKQYAASLVGSDVIVSTTDKTTGKPKLVQGTVSEAEFYASTGESSIVIGDQAYNLSDVKEVLGCRSTAESETSAKQYAASLVGKNVVVQTTDSKTGAQHKVAGKVQGVTLDPTTGAATLTMAGNYTYNVSDIVEILGDSSSSEGSDSGTAKT